MRTDPIRAELRRRRPQLLIACAAAGLAAAAAGEPGVACACALAGALGWFAFGRRGLVVAVGVFAVSAAFGVWRIVAIDRPAQAAAPGSVIEATATLLERPRPGLFGSSAPMKIETGPARGLRILARRSARTWPASDPGVRFRIRGFVRPP